MFDKEILLHTFMIYPEKTEQIVDIKKDHQVRRNLI